MQLRLIPLIFSLVVGAGHIRAEESDSANGEARELFNRGEEHYANGEYEQAAIDYLKAYNLSGRAALLFNAAQAYRLDGKRDAAIAQYRRYLKASPDGEMRGVAEEHLKNLLDERGSEGGAATAPPPAPTRPGRGSTIAGHVLLTSGIALGIAGGALAFRAHSLNDEVLDHRQGAWTSDLLDKRERAETLRRYAIVGGAVSGAALVASAFFYWRGYRAASESRIAITPLIDQNHRGFVFSWRHD